MKALSLLSFSFICHAAIAAPPLAVNGNVYNAHCGGSDGGIDPYVNGGTPPYTYLWNNGSTQAYLTGLSAGDYTLTVTDVLGATAEGSFTVQNISGLFTDMPAQDGHVNCPGHCWGEFQILPQYLGGTPPYTYSLPVAGIDGDGDPYFQIPGGACGNDTYDLQINDAGGCSGTMHVVIFEPMFGTHMQATAVQGSCTGGTGGSTTITQVYDGNFFQAPTFAITDGAGNWAGAVIGPLGLSVNVSHLAPGHYVARRNWNASYQYTAYACDDDTLGFDIPDLGVACGTVSGTVYIDHDWGCTQDPADPSLPNSVLRLMPGNEYLLTDANGHFQRDLPDGSYTLEQVDPDLWQWCPSLSQVPFTLAGDAAIITFSDSSTVLQDVAVLGEPGGAHPGFAFADYFYVRNVGVPITGALTATLTFDPLLTFTSASITPTSVTGNVIVWDLSSLNTYGAHQLHVFFDVPASVPIGTSLSQTFTVQDAMPELDVTNNDVAFTTEVTGSFDPNEKTVQTSTHASDALYYIDSDEYVDYTIRFQNTGTAAANRVVVTDTLSELLDMGTFQQGVASHPFSVSFKPGHVVEWRFDNIQLPDSGSDEASSHGLVSFRIKPMQPLVAGTVMSNNADIFFDFNTPVRTNDAVLTAEMSTAVDGSGSTADRLLVYPSPAQASVTIEDGKGIFTNARVLTADGRTVLFTACMTASLSLDVAGLPAGMYVVHVQHANGSYGRTRFVKR